MITILTPTYNRAHTLKRLYESLEQQSNKHFKWLIIDDGSTDETYELVQSLKKGSKLDIIYIYKENGGKHTAINEGMKIIDTPLTFIVDSDDYLDKDAIKEIYKYWSKYKDDMKLVSMWFLQQYSNGEIIGDKFPKDEFVSTYVDVMINSGLKGDKKAVYRTYIRKKYPFPEFKNERFIAESTIHKRANNGYKAVFINKPIYISDYLEDGLTKKGLSMRLKNPLGGMENSKEFLTKDVCLKVRLKKMILYIVYGIIARYKIKEIIFSNRYPLMAILCMPLSFSLYIYWKIKYLNKSKKKEI